MSLCKEQVWFWYDDEKCARNTKYKQVTLNFDGIRSSEGKRRRRKRKINFY